MELLFGVFQFLPLLVVVLIVVAVASVAGGRREPDPAGRRPFVVYLVTIAFVSLVVLIVAATLLVTLLADVILGIETSERAGPSLVAGLIGLAGWFVYRFHSRRLGELLRESDSGTNQARSTYQVYLYAVCSITVLTALISGALAVFAVLRVIAPSLGGGGGGRSGPLDELTTQGFLAVTSIAMFRWHWLRAAALRTPPAPAPPEAAPSV